MLGGHIDNKFVFGLCRHLGLGLLLRCLSHLAFEVVELRAGITLHVKRTERVNVDQAIATLQLPALSVNLGKLAKVGTLAALPISVFFVLA